MTRLIALGGSSCAGKSTLANWLAYLLNCPIIHQDKFFKADKDIPLRDGIADWDCPEAIDFPAFKSYLTNLKSLDPGCLTNQVGPNRPTLNQLDLSSKRVEIANVADKLLRTYGKEELVVVEGYLLYTNEDIIDLFDVSIFLYASYGTLEKRRASRSTYVTLEGSWMDPPFYFRDVVWANYLLYNEAILNKTSNAIKIDSEGNSIEQVILLALKSI